jgi:hypothetical protein
LSCCRFIATSTLHQNRHFIHRYRQVVQS